MISEVQQRWWKMRAANIEDYIWERHHNYHRKKITREKKRFIRLKEQLDENFLKVARKVIKNGVLPPFIDKKYMKDYGND